MYTYTKSELESMTKSELIDLIGKFKENMSIRDIIRTVLPKEDSDEPSMTLKELKQFIQNEYGKTVDYDSVVYTICSKEGLKLEKANSETKKSRIISMLEDGKSNKEIQQELDVSYSHIINVRSSLKPREEEETDEEDNVIIADATAADPVMVSSEEDTDMELGSEDEFED